MQGKFIILQCPNCMAQFKLESLRCYVEELLNSLGLIDASPDVVGEYRGEAIDIAIVLNGCYETCADRALLGYTIKGKVISVNGNMVEGKIISQTNMLSRIFSLVEEPKSGVENGANEIKSQII